VSQDRDLAFFAETTLNNENSVAIYQAINQIKVNHQAIIGHFKSIKLTDPVLSNVLDNLQLMDT
tara:strand:+ start:158 stop:349 length:192 start_codon:yes stop_codon:yes gene_type:complete